MSIHTPSSKVHINVRILHRSREALKKKSIPIAHNIFPTTLETPLQPVNGSFLQQCLLG
ncbi:hypothetical protein ERO13_D11G107566v2 [Gossypium hirsutum]|nr:hypothetical protein ERO13_D11G107566v2 [Gossypium hirsutum]